MNDHLTAIDFQIIIDAYDLGELISAKKMTSGSVQAVYKVETSIGNYIIKFYNRSKESIMFEVEVLKKLEENNYLSPRPLQDKYGETVQMYHDHPLIVYPYTEGSTLNELDVLDFKSMIEKLAELHIITKGFKPLMTQHRLNYVVKTCKALIEEQVMKLNTQNAIEKQVWYEDEINQLDLPSFIPKGVCHGDFHPSNILVEDHKFKCLIDYDDANYTYLLFDIVSIADPFKKGFDWDTWQDFSMDDNVFDFERSKEIIGIYSKVRPLEASEKVHFFDVLKLSILVDAIWYFDRGESNDFFEKRKIDYLNKMGRSMFYKMLFD